LHPVSNNYTYTNGARTHERSASSCLSVRPSVRMEQLGSHWTVFHENYIFEYFFFENQSRKFKSR